MSENESFSAEQYMESLYPEDGQLQVILRSIAERDMPPISVKPGYGRMLTLLVKLSRAKDALEIGALGGYSGLCIARGLPPDGKLVSLELEPDYAELARSNLAQAGCDRAVYRIGEALPNLEALSAEGAAFDFFFIDADKGNYVHYLEWCIKLARPGALIVGDNTLMKGRALAPSATSGSVTAMRRFNELIASDPRLEGVLLAAYDGFALARVKEEAAGKRSDS